MDQNWENKLTFYTDGSRVRSRVIICNHATTQIVHIDLLMTFR